MASAPRLLPRTVESPEVVRTQGRKKLFRRRARDSSQTLRRSIQVAFVALNAVIGVQFYLFVRQFEIVGGAPQVSRPAGVEGWLPIAGLMNLKYFLLTGTIPSVHPAAMILLTVFLAMSLALRKSFCSWFCPVGTLSEGLWKAGRRLLRRNWRLPRWLDIPLRSLKYLLLAFFLWAIGGMSAAGIEAFLASPYGLVADVKMLYFFRFLSGTAATTLLALVVLSLFYQNFWCRYLCPYGALMGLASLLSPAAFRRDPEKCIDCAKCAKACPSLLPVDRLVTVRSAECTGCFECVAVCPAEGALDLALPRRRIISAWAVALAISVLFLGVVGYAKWQGLWDGRIPDSVYREVLPEIHRLEHP